MTRIELRTSVAKRLRELRGSQSQEEFAARVGVNQAQISEWESGKQMPGMKNLFRIVAATGANINDLIAEAREAEDE